MKLRRWRRKHTLFLALIIAALVCIYIYSGNSAYKAPRSCTAPDCHVQPTLTYFQLSPNLLLIVIYSSVRGRGRRDAIRSTWVSPLDNSPLSPIQYRFVLGGQDVAMDQLHILRAEAARHGDMIILESVKDDYHSLTERTIKTFQYITDQDFEFSYLFKCDDDTFADLLQVGTALQRRTSHLPLYWGKFFKGPVFTEGRFKETKWSVCNKYLPYCFGGGFILSKDLVSLLAQNEPHLVRYGNEDVSVGAWLAPYNIERKHDARFYTTSHPAFWTWIGACKDVFIVSHKIMEEQMEWYFRNLREEGTMCGSNHWSLLNLIVNGYVYDWTAAVPSQCCRKQFDVA